MTQHPPPRHVRLSLISQCGGAMALAALALAATTGGLLYLTGG